MIDWLIDLTDGGADEGGLAVRELLVGTYVYYCVAAPFRYVF